MRIKVTIEYEVDFHSYAFLGDHTTGDTILEQEKYALIGLISEKLNPGHNIKVEEKP